MSIFNYSKLSLSQVIRRKTRRKASFLELKSSEQIGVLEYIKNHSIPLRVFGYKWYDVLSKKFFAIEYIPVEGTRFSIDKEKREFDSFRDFFNYVQGDVYLNACFYGYDFSDEEINEFSIDLQSINFDSFFNETIDEYTFESIRCLKNENILVDSYEIIKQYNNKKFTVVQRWLDSEGVPIVEKKHDFEYFFDFTHFLNNDLSNADLLLCDGVENINKIHGIKFEGIKVRSVVAEKLGLPLKSIPKDRFEIKNFELTDKHEIETRENFLAKRSEDEDVDRVSYITDIHLLHRFIAYKCKTFDDTNYVIKTIAKTLAEQATSVNLIGGDTSSDFDIFKNFISNLTYYHRRGDFFFTLGNHELWGLKGKSLTAIVYKYREVLEEYGQRRMHLVHNNIFFKDYEWKEITEAELTRISLDDLRATMRSASVVIFGGIGFAGTNDKFNANNGIYMDVLNREEEIKESRKFFSLYEKVTAALEGKNLIVFSHMPMMDWGGKNIHAKKGIIYVSGHDHKNYFYDDGQQRIFADNQVGYRGNSLSFKQIPISFNFDWFADYKDGIYEITRSDYKQFYRGIREGLTFNRQFKKLFVIKHKKAYMFLMQNTKGTMFILNGGAIKSVGNHPLEYFYENLSKYSNSVNLYLSKYNEFQKKVSNVIKQIGGAGRIHGCIVDIDFFNHLYINPLDKSITPYFAYSMVDKYVYDNLQSLLKFEGPELFSSYEKLIGQQGNEDAIVIYSKNLPITKNTTPVYSTEMYRVSRIIKGLQFTTKYNIVRLWNDALVTDSSEENGKLIVSEIIGLVNP